MSVAPLFSVITPVYNPPPRFLRAAIRSVQAQTFHDWELILVDDLSPDPEILPILEEAAQSDPRIRVIARAENGGISVASNDAVAAAGGEFIALLDHDDLLTPYALEAMADAIEREPEVDYLYSDEDRLTEGGVHFGLFEKPEWSLERLRNQNYATHLSVLRTSVVRAVGGFDARYDGAQDHDLILKVTERASHVVHVPKCLYSWRILPGSTAHDITEKPYAWTNGVGAVQAHLDRVGIDAKVDYGRSDGTYTITRAIPDDMRVSIVIPTRGSTGMVWGENRFFVVDAVRSALEKAGHHSVQVVVVYDLDTGRNILTELAEVVPEGDLMLVPYDDEFNFSRKCNLGALASDGDVVVLLNDDTQARSEGWLVQLVAPLLEPDVGMTGARLLFEDGTLQHGGHVHARGAYTHAFIGARGSDLGHAACLVINRECSGVTCACAALRRQTFIEVGGLCEKLPSNYNDVDISNKIVRSGYRILWMANVELYHFESKSRDPRVSGTEINFVRARWGVPYQAGDPFLPVWS
jgi:glycosyltransferase involved in cell wall biosynthesis